MTLARMFNVAGRELCAAIHETMQGLGYTLRRQDEARLLGRGGGYAIVKL